MKRLSMLLIPCIAISANAATFNAQGKTINSNDAQNPGIVKFEKNKIDVAKNNLNKPTPLAKTYTPAWVNTRKATYNQDARTYTFNDNNISEEAYLNSTDYLERYDDIRANDWSNSYTDYNNRRTLPNKTVNNCSRISGHFSLDFDYTSATMTSTMTSSNNTIPYALGTYDNAYNYNMLGKMNNSDVSWRCLGFGAYNYTCGKDIHIYNIVGDDPVAFNGNSCVDSRTQNYKEGIKHYYANKFINYLAENAYIHSYKDRKGIKFAQHPSDPYNNNMHIGNVISSSYKNQTSYNMEAAALDDYIYNNRVIEFAPYTNENGRTGAGLALNAITVAGATGKWYTGSSSNPSGHKTLENTPTLPLLKYGNSSSKYNKPEVYAVSNGLFTDDYRIKHDDNEYEYEGIIGAWGASTVAAAMTADLLQKHPFYKWHPEVVKALWVSAKSKKADNQGQKRAEVYRRESSSKAGTLTTFDDLLYGNNSRYWYGNNTDYLGYNNKITFTESVEPGQYYAFAIAWLVRGDYALNEYNLSSNFQLTISYKLPSGSTKTYSSSDGGIQRPATYRSLQSINIPSGVNSVTVTIERFRDTGDRLVLGYNMHKMAQ